MNGRRSRLVLLAGAIVLALAGCRSDAPSSAATAAAPVTVTVTAAATGVTSQAEVASFQLTVGENVEAGYSPDAIVALLNSRAARAGLADARVTAEGPRVTIRFPRVPNDQQLGLLATSAVIEMRPVLLAAPASGASAASAGPWPTLRERTDRLDPSDLSWVTAELAASFDRLDCAPGQMMSALLEQPYSPSTPYVACSEDGSEKFILGIAEVRAGIVAVAPGDRNDTLRITLSDGDAARYSAMTQRVALLDGSRQRIALMFDRTVVVAPMVMAGATGATFELSLGDASRAARLSSLLTLSKGVGLYFSKTQFQRLGS